MIAILRKSMRIKTHISEDNKTRAEGGFGMLNNWTRLVATPVVLDDYCLVQ